MEHLHELFLAGLALAAGLGGGRARRHDGPAAVRDRVALEL